MSNMKNTLSFTALLLLMASEQTKESTEPDLQAVLQDLLPTIFQRLPQRVTS
jgi:hypothetical protein